MHSAGRVPPIIFITGDGDRFIGEASSPDAPMLHKPFDEETLVAAISDAVGTSSQRQG